MTRAIHIILIILNGITFALYGIDKAKAKLNGWRISEKKLLTWSILGGVGGLIGMEIFRHKTRKSNFRFANILGIFLTLAILMLI